MHDLDQRLNVTSVVITHDIFSVYKVATRVIMLHDGLVWFEGTPDDMRTSKDPIVQDFIARYTPGSGRHVEDLIGE